MRLFGTEPAIPAEYLAVFHDNGEHGTGWGANGSARRRTLAGTLAPEEQMEYITPSGLGVVAVTDARIMQIARGRVAAAFARAAVRRSMVHLEGHVPYVLLTGEDGPLAEPIHFFDLGEALAFSTVRAAAPGRVRRPAAAVAAADRPTRPDRARGLRPALPRRAAAARAAQRADDPARRRGGDGRQLPAPGTPDWNEYETRLCTDLLDAVTAGGEWAIAGALYVACDLDVDSVNPAYRESSIRGRLPARHDVPRALWPWFMDP